MSILRLFRVAAISFLCLTLMAGMGHAADNKNYGDCDVCPGALHYGPKEAREIIGNDGRLLITNLKLKQLKRVAIDLDGVLQDSSETDAEGYELKIYGVSEYIYIKSLIDGSFIQVITDPMNAHLPTQKIIWNPEIYIQSGGDRIALEDSLEAIHEKLATSEIYEWIVADEAEDFKAQLGNRIALALKLFQKAR